MSIAAERLERPKGAASVELAALTAALDELAAIDLSATDDAGLLAEIVELRALLDRGEAVWLARVAAADRRGAAQAEEQAGSTAAFLRDFCLLSPAFAGQKRMVARRLEDLSATAAAFTAGEISYEHVRVIATGLTQRRRQAAQDAGLDVPAAEAALVDLAKVTDPVLLRDRVTQWADAFDHADVAKQERGDHEAREFHFARTLGGLVALKGLLDVEGGELLIAAVTAAMGTPAPEDTRSAAQRRADALVDVLHLAADAGTLPDRGGERPHIGVIIDLETLERRLVENPLFAGGMVRSPLLMHTGPLTAEAARRLACDAGVHRILLDPAGVPLGLGRRTRTVSPGLRRALLARDGAHCAFPGCGRAASYCDAHHIRHWIDRGPTDLDNLVLLCRFHHRKVHHSNWSIRAVPNGRPIFYRPDGMAMRSPPDLLAA